MDMQDLQWVRSAMGKSLFMNKKQVAQLWQRDCASSINDFGVNLRLKYRLKGYFSHHCHTTQFTLTHHMGIK